MDIINAFDWAIMNFVQGFMHNPVTDTLFPIITYLGEAGGVWILASVVLIFIKRTRKFGILALVALLLTFITGNLVLKNLFARPRPFVTFPDYQLLIPPPHGYSFPSGHSSSSFAVATVLLSLNKKLGICACILALLIAFSRVFLFVHYPTDVIVGAILGILFGLATLWVYSRITKSNS